MIGVSAKQTSVIVQQCTLYGSECVNTAKMNVYKYSQTSSRRPAIDSRHFSTFYLIQTQRLQQTDICLYVHRIQRNSFEIFLQFSLTDIFIVNTVKERCKITRRYPQVNILSSMCPATHPINHTYALLKQQIGTKNEPFH